MKTYTIKKNAKVTEADVLARITYLNLRHLKNDKKKPPRRQILEKQAKKNNIAFDAQISNTKLHFLIHHAPKIEAMQKKNDALVAAGGVIVKAAGLRKNDRIALIVGKILDWQIVHVNTTSGSGRNTKILSYEAQILQIFKATGIAVVFSNDSPTGKAIGGVTCKLA
jgi:hypothetical protein